MSQAERTGVAAVAVSVAIGVAISWAGSQGGTTLGALPVFALCGLLSFGINWLVFVPAYVFQTERYFDLTGSVTYLSIVGVALVSGTPDVRALILGAMVAVWAVRLGGFLFARIRRDGGDGRFDALKPSLPRFLMTWTLQALWVLLTLSSALAAMTTARPEPLGAFAGFGVLIWVLGFRPRSSPIARKVASAQTPPIATSSSSPASGRGRDTPTTSGKSCSGVAWPSWRSRS